MLLLQFTLTWMRKLIGPRREIGKIIVSWSSLELVACYITALSLSLIGNRDGRFGSNVGQIGPKWDKSGAFSGAPNALKSDLKSLGFVPFRPHIWPTLEPNLPSLLPSPDGCRGVMRHEVLPHTSVVPWSVATFKCDIPQHRSLRHSYFMTSLPLLFIDSDVTHS